MSFVEILVLCMQYVMCMESTTYVLRINRTYLPILEVKQIDLNYAKLNLQQWSEKDEQMINIYSLIKIL